MDFTKGPYCKLSRVLLKLLGQWPDQKWLHRVFLFLFFFLFMGFTISSQMSNIIRSYRDLTTVIATVPTTCSFLVCSAKVCTLTIHSKKVKNLHDQMDEHWRQLKSEEEIEIMKSYVKTCIFQSVCYTVYQQLAGVLFGLPMTLPLVLNIVAPRNESRPVPLIYPVYYYLFDEETHFHIVKCHMIFSIAYVTILLAAVDTMFMMYVQYVCGMFAVVGHRLEHTLYHLEGLEESTIDEQLNIYKRYMALCVETHCKAVKFADTIESIFSLSYFLQSVLNVICMSTTLIMLRLSIGSPAMLRQISYVIGQLFHLFFNNYQGQNLINHSLGNAIRVYSGPWYTAPIQIQKMLLFVQERSAVPCYLTAGKMFIFSLETFTMLTQACMSYFMVLASFQ